MPSEHERETIFLRRCIRYDDSASGRRLAERIVKIQREDRSMRRASWLMALLAVLAVTGLGYGTVLMDDFPRHMSLFTSATVVKILFSLGVCSLFCLVVFVVVGLVYRRELNKRREECRRLVTRLLDHHLGDARAPHHGGKLHEPISAALLSPLSAPDPPNSPRTL